jgi:hypothetical protein
MRRKRAAGAGRKPKGPIKGKSAAISTRVTVELRRQLDDAASQSGRSLSQEIEVRLRHSLAETREQDSYVRALQYLMTEAFRAVPGPVRSDKYFFAVFRYVLNDLLVRIEPSERIVPPEHLTKSVEELGRFSAEVIWQILSTWPDPTDDEIRRWNMPPSSPGFAIPELRRVFGIPKGADSFETQIRPILLGGEAEYPVALRGDASRKEQQK